jgi:asparagine synthase (glutamine-hydrolysing)
MPGIVGCITRLPREHAEEELLRMMGTLRHEDFYVSGTWVDESLGLYLGWVARRGSLCAEMPLQNERGDVVLLFSGEEYSAAGTAQGLRERGHEFDTDRSSYLVHVCEEDSAFPAALNGRFHGLVIRQSARTAAIFNDRYGINRLYYHESKEAFYFAAEAKAILAVRPELRNIDPRGLGEFIACGCTLENRSLFKGLYVLPGASRWVFRNGSLLKKERYFEPEEWEGQGELAPETYYRELREVFSASLPHYFGGLEQIGMSLTGGLDTRMIMAWQKSEPGSLRCYSFGGMLRDCQDVIVARQVASACKQPYEVIRTGEEFLSRFSYYAERAVYLGDGSVGVSNAPDLYINRKARDIAPVRLTGLFGGEVLRRVVGFKAQEPRSRLFAPEIVSYIREAAGAYAGLLRGHPVSFAVFKQAPWHHFGGLAIEETQVSVRCPYLDNELVRTVFRAPKAALAGNRVSLRLIADGNGALLRIPTDRGLAGERARFFAVASHGVLEFLFKAEYGYDIGMPQWVAVVDHILSPLRIERLFLGRHKIFHFRIWYKGALAQYVREMLLDPRTLSRPFFSRKDLESVVRGHLEGGRNYTSEIHKALTLELMHRLFVDHGSLNSSRRDACENGRISEAMHNQQESVPGLSSHTR